MERGEGTDRKGDGTKKFKLFHYKSRRYKYSRMIIVNNSIITIYSNKWVLNLLWLSYKVYIIVESLCCPSETSLIIKIFFFNKRDLGTPFPLGKALLGLRVFYIS